MALGDPPVEGVKLTATPQRINPDGTGVVMIALLDTSQSLRL